MTFLLTNDDGYNAEGIRILKEKLQKYGRVIIVAPKGPMSAKSCSISINVPLQLVEEEKNVYSVNGTPADCVSFALSVFDEDFDLVISGCNKGLNLSYDSIYSGTIGACLEALTYGKKTIAFSSPHSSFETLIAGFDMAWEFINKNNLISNEYLLNINFPKSGPTGVQLAREYYRKDNTYFKRFEDGYYALRDIDENDGLMEGTDSYFVKNGIISVAPLQRTYYSNTLFNNLNKKLK